MVMGVTTVIFISALGSISDRQNRIQFSQGMRDITSTMSDILNDVSTGYFPTILGLTCTAAADTTNPAPVLGYNAGAGDTTGTKKDCVFAGKVIQIGTDTSASDGFIYSMAGRRLTFSSGGSSDVSSFAELKPVVVDSKNTDNITSDPEISKIDATSSLALPYGIRIVRSDHSDGGRAIGIFYKDFRGVSLNGQSSSGVTSVAIAKVTSAEPSAATTMSQASVITAADDTPTLVNNFLSGNDTVALCFKSGTTDQTATITIGNGISGDLRLDFEVDLSGVACV